MKKQQKQKGFTVVELVIVIAVVAILAAVLIPTFSKIITNANISADSQLARNMNTIIAAEGAAGIPTRAEDVVEFLESNGISKFKPKTAFYHFYWLKNENVIVLADENDSPIYPEEYEYAEYDESNWFDLKYVRDHPLPPTEAPESIDQPQVFTVTLRTSGYDDGLSIPLPQTPAIEGQPYQVTLNMPIEEDRIRRFRKITAIMKDGEEEYEFVIRKQFDNMSDVSVTVDIPVVTGDITINVGIIEFVRITVIGDNIKEDRDNVRCQIGMQFTTIDSAIRHALKEGYRATSAKITMGGKSIEDIYGDIFDKERHEIAVKFHSLTIRDDVVIEIESEWITYTVDFIIRDGKSEDIKVTKIVSYPSNDCLLDLSKEITNTDFKVLNKYYISSPSIRNEDYPELEYIESQKTFSIENITTNLTVYIFVDSIE